MLHVVIGLNWSEHNVRVSSKKVMSIVDQCCLHRSSCIYVSSSNLFDIMIL